MDAVQLKNAAKTISRHARLYEIFPEKSNGLIISCKTSASMPIVKLSKKGVFIFHDLRFFDLLHHAVLGLNLFDNNIDLPTGKTMGRFHLDSLLWTTLAERSLNTVNEDLALALGLLTQESMHYEHSLRTMGAYAPQLQVSNSTAKFETGLFQAFALGHELAHFDFKSGEKQWSDKEIKTLLCILNLIDEQAEALKSKPTSNPDILNMFVAVQKIRGSKTLFEEILADIASISSMLSGNMPPIWSGLPMDLRIWLVATTVLYGLAGTKLMTYVMAFAAQNRADFEKTWVYNCELFDARITFLVKFFNLLIYSHPEDDLSESPEEINDKIYLFIHELFESLWQAEASLKPRFERISELRADGQAIIERDALERDAVFSICATMLGWKSDKSTGASHL